MTRKEHGIDCEAAKHCDREGCGSQGLEELEDERHHNGHLQDTRRRMRRNRETGNKRGRTNGQEELDKQEKQ